MVLVQPDFAGKVSCLEGEDAREEFQRIFGFPAEYIIVSAMRGLRPVHEADHLHSQASAEGSGLSCICEWGRDRNRHARPVGSKQKSR